MLKLFLVFYSTTFISKVEHCMRMMPSEPGIPITTIPALTTVPTEETTTTATTIPAGATTTTTPQAGETTTIVTTTTIATTTTTALGCGLDCKVEPLLKETGDEEKFLPEDWTEYKEEGCLGTRIQCERGDVCDKYTMYMVYENGDEVEGEFGSELIARSFINCSADDSYYYAGRKLSSIYCTAVNCS